VQGALALPPVKIGFADPWNQKQKKMSRIYAASKKAVRFEKDTKSLTRDFVL